MAAAKSTTTTATAAAETGIKAEFKTIKALVVKSVAKSFRRIGLAFTQEATHLDPDLLTEDQIKTLSEDPNLSIRGAEVTVPVATTVPTTPVVVPVATDDTAAAK